MSENHDQAGCKSCGHLLWKLFKGDNGDVSCKCAGCGHSVMLCKVPPPPPPKPPVSFYHQREAKPIESLRAIDIPPGMDPNDCVIDEEHIVKI